LARIRSKSSRGHSGSVGALDARSTARVLSAAADATVLLDRKGTVLGVWSDLADLADEGAAWVGRPWADTVSADSREKIAALMRDAAAPGPRGRWRQVNHVIRNGATVPVSYRTVKIGDEGRCIAVGRDLRPVSSLQQRLIETEQAVERDYMRLRNAETRYRLLFQIASEAVLIVDAGSQRIVEANPVAASLLEPAPKRLVGRTFPEGFDDRSTRLLQDLLAAARTTGSGNNVRVRTADSGREYLVSASMFQQEQEAFFLIRLAPTGQGLNATGQRPEQSLLIEFVEKSPDPVVVVDGQGRVISANRAFLERLQIASAQQAQGESLDRWLGRPGVDLGVLLSNLRQHGHLRQFPATLHGEHGVVEQTELSAVTLTESGGTYFGFSLRDPSRRSAPAPESRSGDPLSRSPDQLAELVGRVALKDLVRESTDVIEKLCIEAALRLSEDNRVSAAEMLGLSRQSLYVKLRRFGLVAGSSARPENGGHS
jgi:transcriptional regulator PpsR